MSESRLAVVHPTISNVSYQLSLHKTDIETAFTNLQNYAYNNQYWNVYYTIQGFNVNNLLAEMDSYIKYCDWLSAEVQKVEGTLKNKKVFTSDLVAYQNDFTKPTAILNLAVNSVLKRGDKKLSNSYSIENLDKTKALDPEYVKKVDQANYEYLQNRNTGAFLVSLIGPITGAISDFSELSSQTLDFAYLSKLYSIGLETGTRDFLQRIEKFTSTAVNGVFDAFIVGGTVMGFPAVAGLGYAKKANDIYTDIKLDVEDIIADEGYNYESAVTLAVARYGVDWALSSAEKIANSKIVEFADKIIYISKYGSITDENGNFGPFLKEIIRTYASDEIARYGTSLNTFDAKKYEELAKLVGICQDDKGLSVMDQIEEMVKDQTGKSLADIIVDNILHSSAKSVVTSQQAEVEIQYMTTEWAYRKFGQNGGLTNGN